MEQGTALLAEKEKTVFLGQQMQFRTSDGTRTEPATQCGRSLCHGRVSKRRWPTFGQIWFQVVGPVTDGSQAAARYWKAMQRYKAAFESPPEADDIKLVVFAKSNLEFTKIKKKEALLKLFVANTHRWNRRSNQPRQKELRLEVLFSTRKYKMAKMKESVRIWRTVDA